MILMANRDLSQVSFVIWWCFWRIPDKDWGKSDISTNFSLEMCMGSRLKNLVFLTFASIPYGHILSGRVHISSGGLDPYYGQLLEFLDESVSSLSPTSYHWGAIFGPADLVILRMVSNNTVNIYARWMKFYRGDLRVGHPNFAEGSQAATQQAGSPADISASEIIQPVGITMCEHAQCAVSASRFLFGISLLSSLHDRDL
jgi:hypothetical protein